LAHDVGEVRKALNDAIEMKDVAVILMTERLISMCPELVYDLKLNLKRPLIVEIPDRHGNGRTKDSITRYVREAIGVKI
jgi:V/A-type H+-transporting ATPase subunit F